MKILFVNNNRDILGGAEVYLYNLADALREKGHEALLLYGVPAQQEPPAIENHFVPGIHEFTLWKRRKPIEEFRKIVGKEAPDVLHLLGTHNPFLTEEALRSGLPAVRTMFAHGAYCVGGAKLFRTQQPCDIHFGARCLLYSFCRCRGSRNPLAVTKGFLRAKRELAQDSRLDKIFTASRYAYDCLAGAGVDKAKLEYLPYFTELPPEEECGLFDDENIIFFTGRAIKEKGLKELLDAMALVQEPCRLIVDAEGPELGAMKDYSARLGIADKVDFVGWADKKTHASFYRKSLCAAVPSIWPEPFGLVGIEAMAYAKPTIAFDVGGVREWCIDGETGFLVEPLNVAMLAEKIEALIRDRALAERLGRAGRRRAETTFSKETYIAKLCAVYREAMERKR